MREVDIHDAFARFRDGGPLMIPLGPEAARRVSSRRRRARIAATTVAVVAAIAAPVIAYGLVPRDATPDVGSSPTPTTSSRPTPDVSPTGMPVAMALQPSDVPTGYPYAGDDIDGDWSLEFAASLCEPPDNLSGLPSAEASWGAAFRMGSGAESRAILQRIDRYPVAQAQAYIEAVRGMVQRCEQPFGEPRTWSIVDQGFAGDESLVLRWEGSTGASTYILVRAGDLVTQIWYKDPTTLDPVQLGQRAAARLCEGTTTC